MLSSSRSDGPSVPRYVNNALTCGIPVANSDVPRSADAFEWNNNTLDWLNMPFSSEMLDMAWLTDVPGPFVDEQDSGYG